MQGVLEEYSWLIFIIVIALAGWLVGSLESKVKGAVGEKIVSSKLHSLPRDKYIVIDNIMLRTSRGTTQVDHIVVSIYGIFVIETKNYKGKIYGDEYSEKWKQYLGRNKYTFHNPVRQNYGHVKSLESLLGLSEDKFIPIVTFSGNAQLKVKTKGHVVYYSNLKKTILRYKTEVFSVSTVSQIAGKICALNVDSKDVRKEHIKDIRRKHKY